MSGPMAPEPLQVPVWDLTGAPSGTYTLTVTDVNICEVVSGPYVINDFAGPTLVEDYMEILPSICGAPNGSITGIFSSGSTALTYEWYDGVGNPVGSNIDLLNVAQGQYTLLIQDENGCDTTGGPYIIDGFPSAIVDATNMLVTASTCGNPDGSIAGLTVAGTAPYTFESQDETSNSVRQRHRFGRRSRRAIHFDGMGR